MSSSIFTKANLTQQNTQPKEQSQNVEISERYFVDGDYITDMHVHTCHSHEGTFYMTPREYMDRAVKVAKEHHCKVRLSFTDHQSIFGSKEAIILKQKYPEKYKDVEVVSGIEISVDLSEINKNVKTEGSYSSCHLLVYNYDINNKELNAFSKLFYYSRKGAPYMGAQILTIKKMLKECGLDMSYSQIFDFYQKNQNLNSKELARAFTILLLKNNLIDKSQFRETAQKMYNVLQWNIKSKKNDSKFRDILKVSLSDFKELVESSGGKVVIAHPSLLSKNGEHTLSKLDMINELTGLLKDYLGDLLVGMEVFYPGQFLDGKLTEYLAICKNNNLYPTCGSDCHGPNKEVPLDIFLNPVAYEFSKQLNVNNEDIYATMHNYITNLKIFDYLSSGEHAKDKQSFDYINKNAGKLDEQQLKNIATEVKSIMDQRRYEREQQKAKDREESLTKKHEKFLPIVVDNCM